MEPVRPGEHKLGIVKGEFPQVGAGIARGGFGDCVWFAGTNCVQQFLRLAFELIEVRVPGEHAGRERLVHNEAPFLAVHTRISGFARCPLSRAEKSSSKSTAETANIQGDSVLSADTVAP
jgi:hypothetical protein